jgi:hypothetical protein
MYTYITFTMKKLLTIVLIFISFRAFSQDSLKIYNYQRNHIETTGFTVIGSWGAANIAGSAIGYSNSTGSTRSFYQMNIYWGAVNLGLATLGYIGARKDEQKQLSPAESLEEQKKIETIFLVNAGLDLAYIGTGVYLKHRGDSHNSDQLRGYGTSVIMQGGVLFLFDSIMYTSEKHNGTGLRNCLTKNPIIFDGKKVGMIINL